jgi:hypothetical protein
MPLGKARLTVTQIVSPDTYESIVESNLPNLFQAILEISSPTLQRSFVMRRDIFTSCDLQRR